MARMMFQYLILAAITLGTGVLSQDDKLGLADGYLTLQTQNFNLKLVKEAQLLASIKPTNGTFDFSPFDYLPLRSDNGQYHVGDVTFRYRVGSDTEWNDVDSAQARVAVTSISSNGLAASNLGPTIPASTPLNITREWLDLNGDLGLVFTISNTAESSVEIGSLGFPLEFNSIFTNRSALETQEVCSLTDPYIGLEAGYVQVTPVSGVGPVLVVTALNNTKFEAWRNLNETSYPGTEYGSQTFEGYYEWQVFSKAWAENEWKDVVPWNPPTSKVLEPNEEIKVGLKFSIASEGVRGIESTVRGAQTPYALGIPGYILPQDLTAKLFLFYSSPVQSFSIEPSGAIVLNQLENNTYSILPSSDAWGRVRLTITYVDGKTQAVHYYVIKPGPETLKGLGTFLTTSQWYTNTSDPFGRAPSIITYDRSVNNYVLQDNRVWIAGLSDEGGAGSFLAAGIKQATQPNADEISKLERFVDSVLFKTIQLDTYAVRKSIFFYQPDAVPGYVYNPDFDWSSWSSWDKSDAYLTDRAYDYVHVTAVYWGMYRAGREYPDLLKNHTWEWYLEQAYQTVKRCFETDKNGTYIVGYANDGLMDETVFGSLLQDLWREGKNLEANDLESRMRKRAKYWDTEAVPFGSEMQWDSTGQEGVYYWTRYFGYDNTSLKALNAVLGYMPTVAHWGWNGNARRYWDNLYAGKLQRIERQIHHYGSGLNSLPVLEEFRRNPTDTYLLRVGYGGMNGPLTNIDQEGFASASFHSFPDTLSWDAYSGDYGPNFVGLALGSAAYLVNDELLGMQVFGGDMEKEENKITVVPRDAIRQRVFIAPLGLSITIAAGIIDRVIYDLTSGSIELRLSQLSWAPQTNYTTMWLESSPGFVNYTVISPVLEKARLGWAVPFVSEPSELVIGKA